MIYCWEGSPAQHVPSKCMSMKDDVLVTPAMTQF